MLCPPNDSQHSRLNAEEKLKFFLYSPLLIRLIIHDDGDVLDEDMTFLKHMSYLRLLCRHELPASELNAIKQLILDSKRSEHAVYGDKVIGPNFHFTLHCTQFIEEVGVPREYWTFVQESLIGRVKKTMQQRTNGKNVASSVFAFYWLEILSAPDPDLSPPFTGTTHVKEVGNRLHTRFIDTCAESEALLERPALVRRRCRSPGGRRHLLPDLQVRRGANQGRGHGEDRIGGHFRLCVSAPGGVHRGYFPDRTCQIEDGRRPHRSPCDLPGHPNTIIGSAGE